MEPEPEPEPPSNSTCFTLKMWALQHYRLPVVVCRRVAVLEEILSCPEDALIHILSSSHLQVTGFLIHNTYDTSTLFSTLTRLTYVAAPCMTY